LEVLLDDDMFLVVEGISSFDVGSIAWGPRYTRELRRVSEMCSREKEYKCGKLIIYTEGEVDLS
jgi:hypothetical protein